MIKRILFISFSMFFITACSIKTPIDQWKHQSISAFNSYKTNFLSGNSLVASNDLKRAKNHAKQSGNLNTLARIYLGECALNITVGGEYSCKSFKDISTLVNNSNLNEYYNFITKKSKKYTNYKYQNITSKLLLSALNKKDLTREEINNTINLSSQYGYKKVTLFWLSQALKISKNKNEYMKISKKILILNSKY